ncbi:hypothetical protein S7335_5134 [Synechococcus sp. PCC 7335]|nr:hypothetical protein S7335_5134 [Synechococcus sp. PCC 7335]
MKTFVLLLLSLRLPQGCQIQRWHPDSPDLSHMPNSEIKTQKYKPP